MQYLDLIFCHYFTCAVYNIVWFLGTDILPLFHLCGLYNIVWFLGTDILPLFYLCGLYNIVWFPGPYNVPPLTCVVYNIVWFSATLLCHMICYTLPTHSSHSNGPCFHPQPKHGESNQRGHHAFKTKIHLILQIAIRLNWFL